MISTRSVELVIDTVVCLTLAKWETVSGQFGGYLMVVHLTQTHQASSCDIDDDDWHGGKKAPGQVFERPTMRRPLAYGHPRYKSKRDIGQGRTARRYHVTS